ncbi:ABC transporter ATP-binding protein [Geosporobacter ferrireducens]|uniref:ABC transporter ATP-binding protein n=1 Tax=Geosporobacter ferrireducens TaxID=1424294 RepID=UPI00139AD188|nr:ABC transporter ATP-binding protein [Geosporobacter ferrireducens]MTI53318.1 ABC transporter ATP-binding protein [Geosporobacter ferrireducens]
MAVITVKNLSKKFKIYQDVSRTIKERVLFPKRIKYTEFSALENVNLEIEKGSTVGLIGENGSGKSTLLKALTKIIYPDCGSIEINGRVSSLLELGAGFHPDFTGKENIYTNASILGLTNKQINAILEEIIKFSELEDFINSPVRTYSSGMYMRLAFSIAINVEPDILLIDEILAVGDASFQKKCFDKLFELKKKGVTIVFVSHDIGAVQQLCDQVIWLAHGKIVQQGDSGRVIKEYIKYMSEKDEKRLIIENNVDENIESKDLDEENEGSDIIGSDRWGNKKVELFDLSIVDENNKKLYSIETNKSVIIRFKYKINSDINSLVFGIAFRRADNFHCYGTNTQIDQLDVYKLNGEGTVEFIVDNLALIPNTYSLDVAAHSKSGEIYDYHYEAYKFTMFSEVQDQGLYRVGHQWNIR